VAIDRDGWPALRLVNLHGARCDYKPTRESVAKGELSADCS
jgi:hypothetical protein